MIIERRIQNRSVRAECAERYSRMAVNVLDVFEKLAADGRPIGPGVQIRFGWSLLRLVEDGSGLRVAEPDFALWPQERWVPTIDTTLAVLSDQTALLHRLGVDAEDVFFDQFIVSAAGAVGEAKMFLRRTSSIAPLDSGWLLGSTGDPEALTRENGLERIFVASLAARRAPLLQVLTLPCEFIALFSGDSLDQVVDPAGRPRLRSPSDDTEQDVTRAVETMDQLGDR